VLVKAALTAGVVVVVVAHTQSKVGVGRGSCGVAFAVGSGGASMHVCEVGRMPNLAVTEKWRVAVQWVERRQQPGWRRSRISLS
jgi:hypothetical protein